MGVAILAKPVVWCDNTSAVAIAVNPIHHARMKHVEIELHFDGERVAEGKLEVNYVPSGNQVADILNKALPQSISVPFRSKLRVVSFAEAGNSSSRVDFKHFSFLQQL